MFHYQQSHSTLTKNDPKGSLTISEHHPKGKYRYKAAKDLNPLCEHILRGPDRPALCIDASI